MRNLFTFLFAVLIGCTSSDSHPIAPSTPPFPNLTVLVKVSGDPSTRFGDYAITIDGAPSIVLGPSAKARIVVAAGNHTIALAPSQRNLLWCSAIGPTSFSGLIRGDSVTDVTFSVNCPPLVATGTLQLSLSGSGTGAPAGIPVSLRRINEPPPPGVFFALPRSSSFYVPADKPLEVALPSGLYIVGASPPENCLPVVFLGTGIPFVAVREGAAATVGISYKCT